MEKILMKSFFNTLFYLLIIFSFVNNRAYSLSENQREQICQNKPKRSICKKYLKFRKFNLLKGNRIEIPVIPFKNK